MVHGAYALAAALNRGVRVEATPSPVTRIISEDLGLAAGSLDNPPNALRPVAAAVKATLSHLSEKNRLTLRISSELPRASGLGSSSAVAVASVAAVASALHHTLSREELAALASVSERLVHGNPSGVDVNVAIHGGVILFRKGLPVRRTSLGEATELVVGVSGIERRTSAMVEAFARIRESFPSIFRGMVVSASRFSELASEALTSGDMETLGSILNYQHTVLKAFGMSIDILDRMVEEALRAGALGAKLTGAGGGGCIIALPPKGGSEKVRKALGGICADAFVTTMPTGGVKTWRSMT